MFEVLHLSHWDDAVQITVPSDIVQHLTNYHKLGVRFLYSCYRKGQSGAILNAEHDMNAPIQVTSFLSALHHSVTVDSPAIVICSAESLCMWHYNLANYLESPVTILTETTSQQILKGKCSEVILSVVENLKLLKNVDVAFFTVVVDELDLLINKRFVKQMKGQFHIGLTTRNFLKHPDQKLFRNMLLWSNPGVIGKLEDFCREDTAHLNNLRYMYGDWWFRLTWCFCDTFKKPSQEEKKKYQIAVQRWSIRNSVSVSSSKVLKKRTQSVVKSCEFDAVKPESSKREAKKRKRVVRKRKSSSSESSGTGELNVAVEIHADGDLKKFPSVTSSQETVNYDLENDADDFPILTSIINNSEVICDFKEERIDKSEVYSMLFDEPKIERCEDGGDILLSIMNDKLKEEDVTDQKKDILSVLYGDN